MNLYILTLLFFLLSSTSHSCNKPDLALLTQAFSSVSNFQLQDFCFQIQELRLPSRNLTGTVSWMLLKNLSALRAIDLSGNSLQGSIPGGFWSSPSLVELNLAHNRLGGTLRFEPGSMMVKLNLSSNRFTSAVGVSGFDRLQSLDLSRNNLSLVPLGLEKLRGLKYLDVSCNSMSGNFPRDFPTLDGLRFINVSFNNLTGNVDSRIIKKFGSSAFIKAGSLVFIHKQEHNPKSHRRVTKLVIIVAVSVSIGLVLLSGAWLFVVKRRRKKGRKEEEGGVRAAEEVESWVAEARWSAPVVVFEKPLMELTFSDLAAATSGFSRESQLAEGGRRGPAYRAVLPGDLHVVVRVMERERGAEERAAEAAFRELARLRHPNLLPLLGYCIAGREKLLLYEYMERGDLHQWLHELPAGQPNIEDWSVDAWDRRTAMTTTATMDHWPTRHRIALGIARGLAFLHQGWAGSNQAVIHGHLVPSNILFDGNLEPRIADFATDDGGGGTTETDVYSYGILVMELMTGRAEWPGEEVERLRKLVREGKGLLEVDFRMRAIDGSESKWEMEMIQCLRVGYLCTAQSPEKRPTMQQVVGLVKDIRPSATSSTPS